MHTEHTWELPFGESNELELHTEWGQLTLLPVEPGRQPRLELTRGASENIAVHVDRESDVVRVALEPSRSFNWFGGWECRATVYVPRNVRANVQTSAGSVVVRDLEGCELGIKANAGKIDLTHVRGLLHLSADAGSISGTDVGGYFDVETQAGSVRLEVTDIRPGEHRIRASMGSLRLELARGLDVTVETRTSLGSVRNNFQSRPDAAARLMLSTEMGSVRVEEARLARPPSPPVQPRTPDQPPSSRVPEPDPELERILKMVEAGQISAQDADELLRAMGRA